MRNRKQEQKSARAAGVFRKKCTRLIAYIFVFFIVFNRKLSVKYKKRLAVSFSSCVVLIVVLFSLSAQRKVESTIQKMSLRTTLAENHNRVIVRQTQAKIEINRSHVLDEVDEPDSEMTEEPKKTEQKSGQPSSAAAVNKDNVTRYSPNKVKSNGDALTHIQALLANNEERKQSDTIHTYYQYPVRLGHDIRQNYDRGQSATDFIMRKVYNVMQEDERRHNSDSLSQAVSSQAVSFRAADVSQAVTAQAVTAQAVDIKGTNNASVPMLILGKEKMTQMRSNDKIIFCTKDNHIQINASEDKGGSSVEEVCYAYGDKLKYSMKPFSNQIYLDVPESFYGQVLAKCTDSVGITSESLSEYFLVESQAPKILFTQDTICAAPYTLWVTINESGHIVSGIRDVSCTIDGKEYNISDLEVNENIVLDEGLTVPTKCEFPISFTETGSHRVAVTAVDYAGNRSTKETVIQIQEPELISVFMPSKFAIHIDPQQLAGKEQIYSDDILLKNGSNFDVKVTVKNVQVTVKDEVSDEGIKKDCSLYMIAPDTGERLPLRKGKNEELYSYCLPKEMEGQRGKLRFVGETTKGSDVMWKDSDVVITVDLGFSREERK